MARLQNLAHVSTEIIEAARGMNLTLPPNDRSTDREIVSDVQQLYFWPYLEREVEIEELSDWLRGTFATLTSVLNRLDPRAVAQLITQCPHCDIRPMWAVWKGKGAICSKCGNVIYRHPRPVVGPGPTEAR